MAGSASSRQGSADQPLRIVLPDGQPVGGVPSEPVAQWEVVPQGVGAGSLVQMDPIAPVPVPPEIGADSAATPRERSRHRGQQADDPATQRTWMSQVQDKTKLLRDMFELEGTEVCISATFPKSSPGPSPRVFPPADWAGSDRSALNFMHVVCGRLRLAVTCSHVNQPYHAGRPSSCAVSRGLPDNLICRVANVCRPHLTCSPTPLCPYRASRRGSCSSACMFHYIGSADSVTS